MAIQLVDTQGLGNKVDGTRFNALRTSARPLEYQSNGTYGATLLSGVMAAGLAAGAEVFQFRWTDPSKKAVIQEILFEGAGSIVAFTAGVGVLKVNVHRSWTVDGSGGTPATMTGDNGKLLSTMATSLMGVSGSMRIASTAALVAGTKTTDVQGIGGCVTGVPAAAGAQVFPNNALFQPDQLHPLVLGTNEGFSIVATVPATGTWSFGVTIRWAEVDAY